MKIETLMILLACDATSRNATADRRTGQPPILWRGNGVTLRCAAFVGDPAVAANLVDDWTGATSASLVLRATNSSGTVLATKTVAAADFDTDLTYADWTAGEGHFDFVLTGADTNQTMGSDGRLGVYFAVQLAVAGSADPITIATGIGEIREDGIGDAETPTTPDYTAWSKPEADARFLRGAMNLSDVADAAAARENLGLAIGVNVPALVDGKIPVAQLPDAAINEAVAATESAIGLVELATQEEVDAVSNVDAVVRAKHMRVKVETGNGNAISIGDLGGDTRGYGSITMQASRELATQVASGQNAIAIGNNSTASGYYGATAIGSNSTASEYKSTAIGNQAAAIGSNSTAIGNNSTASGYKSTAIGSNSTASGNNSTASGNYCSASGYKSTAIGDSNTAIGNNSTAIGNNSTASGYKSTAIGNQAAASGSHAIAFGNNSTASGEYGITIGNYANTEGERAISIGYGATASSYGATAIGIQATADGDNSTASGRYVKTTINNTAEFGYWSTTGTRGGSIRTHGTGYVVLSTPQTDTAFTDGGATAGSEADGTLMRKGLAFRVSAAGNLIATYCKANGAIIIKDLGAMS